MDSDDIRNIPSNDAPDFDASDPSAPAVFELGDDERESLEKQLIRLDAKIRDHLQPWWDMESTVAQFYRGKHYRVQQGGAGEDADDPKSETQGDEDSDEEQYPVVHFVRSRTRRLVANMLRDDDQVIVESEDSVSFDVGDDHPWAGVRQQYKQQMAEVQAAPAGGPMATPQQGAPGQAPMAPQVADDPDSDNEIAVRLLDARLKKFIKNRRMRSFWRRFLHYAARYRNAALVAYYDHDDRKEPVQVEMLPCGRWGYDPDNLGSFETGEGVYYVIELNDTEFERRYGVKAEDVEAEYAGRVEANKSKWPKVVEDFGKSDARKVKIYAVRDKTTDEVPETEEVTVLDLVDQSGAVLHTWDDGVTPEQAQAELSALFPQLVGGAQMGMPPPVRIEPRAEEREVVDEETGEPVMLDVPRYNGGWKIVHWYCNTVLRVEDNWMPRGTCPIKAYAWEEEAGQIMGVSMYDLGKDANQTINRGQYYYLAQAERSIGGAAANKEDIDNWDEVVDNPFGLVWSVKNGKSPADAVHFHSGIPVSDATVRGLELVQKLADDGLGTDQPYSQAKAVQDNAMAQEGLFGELQQVIEQERERFHEFMEEAYEDVLSLVMEYEDTEATSRIERADGRVARVSWVPGDLRLDEFDFDVQYSVQVVSPKNEPRNRIAKARYRIESLKMFLEFAMMNPIAARILALKGDLPFSKDDLLKIVEAAQNQPQQGPPPEVAVQMQKLQLDQQRIQMEHQRELQDLQIKMQQMQADLAIKQAEAQIKADRLALDREKAAADAANKAADREVEKAKLVAETALEEHQARPVALGQ